MSVAAPVPSDLRHHAQTIALLVRWQLGRQAMYLPLLVVVQVLMAVATVAGYGLLVGDPDPAAALYLATGAPTITLVVVGLVMTPQSVATARTEGSHDWMRSLPVPRSLFLVADLALWTVLALPGVVMGVLAGAVRFDVTLDLAWWLPLAVVVVSMTSAAVGYAIALTLAPPIAMLLSQVLVFFVLLFSPISFPRDRMPGWLATAHDWLPVEPMAQAVRAGLARTTFDMPGRSVVVLGAWCVASIALAALALRRRA
ncbi:ABC transporter permease [Sanguibacter massiliensis]|uniref:ABC transporter permease n=1 Tax=Sanguibacter massiliensis TaxID=1973217 RepID=UPI000C81B24D|nr:ABC transporter permease [Sanguibacter massiliensis]